jgi:hypothetical protein
MEFFIRKNATLPYIKVKVFKSGRNDYKEFSDSLTASTITFSMYDEETEIYKILDRPASIMSDGNTPPNYYVYYQFRKTDSKREGRYVGEFKITNSQGEIKLPLRDKLYITVSDSFADSDTCCRPNRGDSPIIFPTETPRNTVTPTVSLSNTPTPSVTSSQTPTPSVTSSQTPTPTNTSTPSVTLTPTITQTSTPTPSVTNTVTPTNTPTNTPSTSVGATPNPTTTTTPTPSVTNTVTPTSTQTSTPTPSVTNTQTSTPTPSVTPTNTPTDTPSQTATNTPTPTNTPNSSAPVTPTVTPTPSFTPTNTVTPTHTPTVTPSPTQAIVPSDPTLEIFYDASDTANFVGVTSSGDTFTQWSDSSATAHNANPIGGASTRPAWWSNVVCGLGGVKFDGTSDGLSVNPITDIANISGFTAIILGKLTNTGTTQQLITSGVGNTSVNNSNVRVSGGTFVLGAANGLAETSQIADTDPHMWTMIFDGSGSTNSDRLKFYVDGVQESLTFLSNVGTVTDSSIDSLYIGIDRVNVSTYQYYYSGFMFEVLLWSRVLPPSELSAVHSYLDNKWYSCL